MSKESSKVLKITGVYAAICIALFGSLFWYDKLIQNNEISAKNETISKYIAGNFEKVTYSYTSENYGYDDIYEKAIQEYPLTERVYPDKESYINELISLNNRQDEYDPNWQLVFYPVFENPGYAGSGKFIASVK